MDFKIEGICPLLQVYDMPATLAFYRDLLGFTMVGSSEPGDEADWVWMRFNELDIMFNTAYERQHRPPAPDPQRVAAHHDTTFYLGCPQVDVLYEYLIGKGLAIDKPIITGYGWKALHVKDPDNYLLIFQWPQKQ